MGSPHIKKKHVFISLRWIAKLREFLRYKKDHYMKRHLFFPKNLFFKRKKSSVLTSKYLSKYELSNWGVSWNFQLKLIFFIVNFNIVNCFHTFYKQLQRVLDAFQSIFHMVSIFIRFLENILSSLEFSEKRLKIDINRKNLKKMKFFKFFLVDRNQFSRARKTFFVW